ncbi:unnamed protein product [Brachionus calyciflorus]|uniref:Uncharacterized protein n=1 Tax=Brachionus calyciflorus TaxID=104777 RepID=A0A814QCI9_9BILA|nr:unnamed protein product [Brachionus calyciflorus]
MEECDKLNSVINFVEELPKLILKRHILANSYWKEFENELKNTFRIEEFIMKFLTLTDAISSITEDEKMFFFKEGVKGYIRKEITCRGITKLSDAIPLAVQLECSFKTEEVYFIKPSKPKFNKNYGKNVTKYSNTKTKYNPKTYVNKLQPKIF